MMPHAMHQAGLVAILVLAGTSVWGETRVKNLVGIIAVHALDTTLALELPRTPTLARRWVIIGPAELRARLVSHPQLQTTVNRTRAALQQAEQSLVQMERRLAIAAADQAIATLEASAGRFHSPELLARAQLAMAQARMLQPSDEDGGLAAARAALQIDPALKPDLHQVPPRTAALLERARRGLTMSTAPDARELALLNRLAGTRGLVWIRLTTRGAAGPRSGAERSAPVGASELTLVVRGPTPPPRTRSTQLSVGPITPWVARQVSDALEQVGVPGAALPRHMAPPTRPMAVTPWYRRWWVWTLAGVMVAGAVTTTVLLTREPEQRPWELQVHF